jgi:DNA-binding SARP family transcriptional activator
VGTRSAAWWAWLLCGVSIAIACAGSALAVLGNPPSVDLDYSVPFFAIFLVFVGVGGLIALRRPDHPIGWLLLAQGLLWQLSGFAAAYATYALFGESRSVVGGAEAGWVLSWLWIPTLGTVPFLFLLFPTGKLRSRWSWLLVWSTVLGCVLALAGRAVAPGVMENAAPITNPFGLASASSASQAAESVGIWLLAGSMIGSIVVFAARLRGAAGQEMLQLRWMAFAGCIVFVGFTIGNLLEDSRFHDLADSLPPISLLVIPVAAAVAILRHRLFDINVIVSRTVVFGGLAAGITAIYLVLVIGVGAAIGAGVGSNVGLAVAATAIAAVVVQPLREALQRAARRLVYGRPTPAESRAQVALFCLGAFRVIRDTGAVPLSAWQSRKARTLLKILIARRGRPVTRDFLMETLWPDEVPEVVTRRLSVAQATVRAVLDPQKRYPPNHFVVSANDALRLDLTNLPVDVERLLADAAQGLGLQEIGSTTEAGEVLRAAERLYEGDFLEEDLYEDWAGPLREESRTAFVSVSRALAELAVGSGDVDAAVRRYLQILDKDPWDAPAHLALVEVLERAGRHGEARRRYRAYVARLEEIGVSAAPFPHSVGTRGTPSGTP